MPSLTELFETLPQRGVVQWIGVRPTRKGPLQIKDQVQITVENGLEDDHYSRGGGKRQVTLIQAEHLAAMASMLDVETIEPDTLRRNLVVSGINLLALKDKEFQVGSATLSYTGLCHPCSRMEEALGPGGYNAMRGHGGITATVIAPGVVAIGDEVKVV